MATQEKYQFEELDDHSREYLLRVRDLKGKGMPGLYVPKNNYLPGFGCFCGLAILITFAVLSYHSLPHEPVAVAMLQTAGLLLGGWLILYAFRVWTASKSSRYAGHFFHADADTLWECSGSTVTTTDIVGIVEAKGVQHFNEGKYQNTAIEVRTSDGHMKLKIVDEERGRQMIVFLNMLAWMRSGGDDEATLDKKTGDAVDFKKLPADIMGGIAKEIAETGEMPKRFDAKYLEIDYEDVPMPKREGRASSGLLNYAIIIGVGVLCFFLLKTLNVGWRDDVIWEEINTVNNQDHRTPLLRGYLADSRNTKHRDAVKVMLKQIYATNIARLRNGNANPNMAVQMNPFGMPPMMNPQAGNNDKVDAALVDGLGEVLMAIAEQPQPIISVSVKENGAKPDPERMKAVQSQYTRTLFEAIGKELAIFVEAPPDTPGLINVTYEVGRNDNNKGNLEVRFLVEYRKSPDAEPVKKVRMIVPVNDQTPAAVGLAAQRLGLKTAGSKKIELQPILEDL